jgi:hypothetical protein
MRDEDDLRAALRSLETLAPDPAGVQPEPGRGPRRLRATQRPGWRRAAAPLAAAASVVAVVAAVLVLTGPDGSRGQAPSSGRSAAQDALASVPAYFVALTGAAGSLRAPWHAAVRATATGKTLATVSPPPPYGTFSGVSGAADDRTFALAAQRWVRGASAAQNASQPTGFFLLRVNPATGAAPLTALPFTEKRGFQVMGMALSPDGSKLAVTVASPKSPQIAEQIQVFTLATGAEHDWAWTGPGWIGQQDTYSQPLSWAADNRTLAFQQWTGPHLSIRLLDTAISGSSLGSARRVVPSVLSSNLDDSNSLLTPDGSTIIYSQKSVSLPSREKLEFDEFSARTGKLLRTLDPWWFDIGLGRGGVPYQQVLWTSASGRTLIVISPPGTSPAGHWVRPVRPVIGVLAGNHFTAIPGSPAAADQDTGPIVAW